MSGSQLDLKFNQETENKNSDSENCRNGISHKVIQWDYLGTQQQDDKNQERSAETRRSVILWHWKQMKNFEGGIINSHSSDRWNRMKTENHLISTYTFIKFYQ